MTAVDGLKLSPHAVFDLQVSSSKGLEGERLFIGPNRLSQTLQWIDPGVAGFL